MRRFFLIVFLLSAYFGFSFSGIPVLEREISLSLSKEPLQAALNKIQEQTGLVFSYSSAILDKAPLVSIQLKQKTVREALGLLLPKDIVYKARNNYVILKVKALEKESKKRELSGYVYDKASDKKIANVTLYDKTTLQTVTTNEYGYFAITLPKEEQCLTVNKENYRDTCVAITQLQNSSLSYISIEQVDSLARKQDSLDWRQKFRDFGQATNRLFKRFKGYVNTLNVKDTLNRNFQLSFLPFIGTNGLMSGNVYNKYSLNIWGGYSRGTRALEMGGIFNIDRENVKGLQMAGAFNLVGDSVSGVQLAGMFNINGKYMDGFQAAGYLNMNLGGGKGVQASGICNSNVKNYSGLSAAGIFNVSRQSFKGLQAAGILNIVGDSLQGSSFAGIMNISKVSQRGIQVAGCVNISRQGDHSLQMAGLLNSTHKGSSDLQVGLVNKTQVLSGLQLGLLNFSDSASGVPIGLFSLVKKGLHQVELSSDELLYTNLSFRTGVNSFYNIFGGGIGPGTKGPLWNFGYGIGTSFRIKNKVRGEASAGMYHLSSGSFYAATSEVYKFYLGLEYRFGKNIALAAGPTFNLYWTDALQPDYENTYSHVAPYYSFNSSLGNGFNLKGWFGARIALRFF